MNDKEEVVEAGKVHWGSMGERFNPVRKSCRIQIIGGEGIVCDDETFNCNCLMASELGLVKCPLYNSHRNRWLAADLRGFESFWVNRLGVRIEKTSKDNGES